MNKKKKQKEGYLYHSSPRPCWSTLTPFYRKTALVWHRSWVLGSVGVFTLRDALTPLRDQPTKLNALCSALPVLYAGYHTDKTSERKKKTMKLGPSYHVLTAQVRQRKPSGNCCVQARESSFTNSFSDSRFVLKLPSHENMLFVANSSNPFPLPPDFHSVTGSFSVKLGVTRSTSVQEGKAVPGKGMT